MLSICVSCLDVDHSGTNCNRCTETCNEPWMQKTKVGHMCIILTYGLRSLHCRCIWRECTWRGFRVQIHSWFDLLLRVTGQSTKSPILGQPRWHKLWALHTDACNLVCINLLMNSYPMPKRYSELLCWVFRSSQQNMHYLCKLLTYGHQVAPQLHLTWMHQMTNLPRIDLLFG